jgi:hypothetical protein
MGLRPLELANWLEFDDHYVQEMALKNELLENSYAEVVAIDPLGALASAELLDEVRANMKEYHADVPCSPAGNDDPIVMASRLVQEDLCVLVREDAWRLRAACVCFPSRWNLASKLGATLDGIHDPVPGYQDHLSSPTNSFFDRLKPERSFWRLNWTLLDSPDLFQPASVRRAPSGDLDQWFFRVERQTLRRLPESGAVVFTIRTYVTSAEQLRDRDGMFTSSLIYALETAPSDVQAYKGWTGVALGLRKALGGN